MRNAGTLSASREPAFNGACYEKPRGRSLSRLSPLQIGRFPRLALRRKTLHRSPQEVIRRPQSLPSYPASHRPQLNRPGPAINVSQATAAKPDAELSPQLFTSTAGYHRPTPESPNSPDPRPSTSKDTKCSRSRSGRRKSRWDNADRIPIEPTKRSSNYGSLPDFLVLKVVNATRHPGGV